MPVRVPFKARSLLALVMINNFFCSVDMLLSPFLFVGVDLLVGDWLEIGLLVLRQIEIAEECGDCARCSN